MANVLPLLSVDGFVTSKDVLMVKLYEHFKASDKSQSSVFKDEVVSLKYIINNSKDDVDIKTDLEKSLSTLYGNYFKSVAVIVTIDNVGSSKNIGVDIQVVDYDTLTYALSLSVNVVNNNLGNYNTQQELIWSL